LSAPDCLAYGSWQSDLAGCLSMVAPSTRVEPAWVTIPSSEELAALGFPMTGYPYGFGFFPAMGRLILAHGRLAPAVGQLFSSVMFDDGALDLREREMVAAVASAAQDCFY